MKLFLAYLGVSRDTDVFFKEWIKEK